MCEGRRPYSDVVMQLSTLSFLIWKSIKPVLWPQPWEVLEVGHDGLIELDPAPLAQCLSGDLPFLGPCPWPAYASVCGWTWCEGSVRTGTGLLVVPCTLRGSLDPVTNWRKNRSTCLLGPRGYQLLTHDHTGVLALTLQAR